MSKIKIVGHASGSGVLTIAAPNTNTDRTITIPDVTGTLLDSGSDLPAANLTGTIASGRLSASNLGSGTVPTARLGSGTASSTTFLRGDGSWQVVAVTPTAVSDQANTSTGGFTMPTGTTAQRPGSPDTGETRMNTTKGSLEFYDGTTWVSTNLIPNISGITGNIYNGLATNLVFTITNNTDNVDVKFSEGGSVFHTVSDQSVSSGSFTLATPSQVYGQTVGDTISITVVNSDGSPSGNAVTKTVGSLPTGGTITTSGDYRIHSFTSSGNFVTPAGFPTVTANYTIFAGGGGGGAGQVASSLGGGGGGGGGYLTGNSSIAASTTYAVVIGAGGAGSPANVSSSSANGSNSTALSLTSIGGGGGGNRNGVEQGKDGGSGGGSCGTASLDGGAGTSGQGNRGGNQTTGDWGATGGGGKTAVGINANSMTSTAGGSGVEDTLTGSTVIVSGGGGGGGSNSGTGGNASGATGNSSGGAGADFNSQVTGGDAPVNRGGGGGGSAAANGSVTVTRGGNGASGRVIIRYDVTSI
jgi:hypothetical protein